MNRTRRTASRERVGNAGRASAPQRNYAPGTNRTRSSPHAGCWCASASGSWRGPCAYEVPAGRWPGGSRRPRTSRSCSSLSPPSGVEGRAFPTYRRRSPRRSRGKPGLKISAEVGIAPEVPSPLGEKGGRDHRTSRRQDFHMRTTHAVRATRGTWGIGLGVGTGSGNGSGTGSGGGGTIGPGLGGSGVGSGEAGDGTEIRSTRADTGIPPSEEATSDGLTPKNQWPQQYRSRSLLSFTVLADVWWFGRGVCRDDAGVYHRLGSPDEWSQPWVEELAAA
jgi:hypothetical protein